MRTVFMAPSRQLTILRLGQQAKGWDHAMLVNTIIRGLRR